MKTRVAPKGNRPKSYLLGVFVVQHDRDRNTRRLRVNPLRLGLIATGLLIAIYAGAVTAGYIFFKKIRKLDQISVVDVALFRWREVRRNLAVHQFEEANADWKAGKYQAAFLGYSTALRNDPSNIKGALEAADFLMSVGATNQALVILKESLQRSPENLPLIEKTFDLLTSTARDKEALAILHGPLSGQLNGSRGPVLRTYELLATFDDQGAAAARILLEKYADLRSRPESGQAVARVLWESKDRFAAIDALSAYVKAKPRDYTGYALLAQYQEAGGMVNDAQDTARRACVALPGEIAPRVLRIGTLSPNNPSEANAWRDEVISYLREFRTNISAVEFLAEVAARKGWVDVARSLYETAVSQQKDLHALGLYYADALLHNQRFSEAGQILDQLDAQTAEGAPFGYLVRQRQVVVASAKGDREGARNLAQRLANSLRQDPDRMEQYRRRFIQMGAPEAAMEFSKALSAMKVASRT